MKEKQMIKNRPEAFKKYKSEVSVLIPLPSKKVK
jgi:steroid 5-alpha reductase family enzyme